MKYRLKHDHSKTLEVDEASAPKMSSWRHVSYRDTQQHLFGFDVPLVFLEETGWESVPEKEPTIEEELREWAADYDNRPHTQHVMLRAAAEIRRLKEEHSFAAADRATRAMLERQVRDAVAKRDGAMNDIAALWKKYKDEVDCNAKLRVALVEKMTEGK